MEVTSSSPDHSGVLVSATTGCGVLGVAYCSSIHECRFVEYLGIMSSLFKLDRAARTGSSTNIVQTKMWVICSIHPSLRNKGVIFKKGGRQLNEVSYASGERLSRGCLPEIASARDMLSISCKPRHLKLRTDIANNEQTTFGDEIP